MTKNNIPILSAPDLCAYFFSELEKINAGQPNQLDTKVILYCSEILSAFSKIQKLFEEREDGYHEKILGLSLLSAQSLEGKNRFKKIKEVADTSLMLCGYFVESIDRKILGVNYYKKVGMFSFLELDKIAPEYMDHQSFFKSMASTYDFVIQLLQILRARQSPQDKKDILHFISPLNGTGS